MKGIHYNAATFKALKGFIVHIHGLRIYMRGIDAKLRFDLKFCDCVGLKKMKRHRKKIRVGILTLFRSFVAQWLLFMRMSKSFRAIIFQLNSKFCVLSLILEGTNKNEWNF